MAGLLKVREGKYCWGKAAIGLKCSLSAGSGVNDVLIHCPAFACCSLEITIVVNKHVCASAV